MQSLAESCRKYLVNPTKDFDLRRWAAEGLAYITMDADVKESLVADRAALKSLVELGKTGDQNVIYGVVSVLANLVNAYEKPEVVPEMKELAQFAKQHVPVEHAKVSYFTYASLCANLRFTTGNTVPFAGTMCKATLVNMRYFGRVENSFVVES